MYEEIVRQTDIQTDRQMENDNRDLLIYIYMIVVVIVIICVIYFI